MRCALTIMLAGLAGCAAPTPPIGRGVPVRVTGDNVAHLVARAGSIFWTETSSVRSLDLESNQASTLASNLFDPWGLIELDDSLLAGVFYCRAPVDCGPSLIRVDLDAGPIQLVASLYELWDARSLAVVGRRGVVLADGLTDGPGHGACGGMGKLLAVDADGAHQAVGPIEVDPQHAFSAFGGVAYVVADGNATISPGTCDYSDAGSGRRLRWFGGGATVSTLAVAGVDLRELWLLGGDDDELFAARSVGHGSRGSDVLAIRRDGSTALVAHVPAPDAPILATVTPDQLLIAIQVAVAGDPAGCGGVTPCLTTAETLVRRISRRTLLAAGPDVVVAQAGELVNELKVVGDRVFAATSRALVELDLADGPIIY